MKNRYFIIALLAVISFLQTSCEGFLDKLPRDKISNEQYWQKSGDLETYNLQFYTAFNPSGFTGTYRNDGSSGSDDMIIKVDAHSVLNGSRAVSTSGGAWDWKNISAVNTFFDNYEHCQDPRVQWEHFLGEAHFFRAWFYFSKVVSFGDVPIYTSALKMDSPELYNPRDQRTDVVDFILQDLDAAIAYLKPLKSVDGGANRLSKEAALIFKSRVALFEGSWQKYHAGTDFATPSADISKYFRAAASAAEELIDGDYTKGVFGSSSVDYGNMFGKDDMSSNQEVILWKAYSDELSYRNHLQVYTTTFTDGRGATYNFVSSFLSKEGKPVDYYAENKIHTGSKFLTWLKENVDPRLSQTIWIPGDTRWDNQRGKAIFEKPAVNESDSYLCATGFQVKKGADIKSPAAGGKYGDESTTGHIMFRYAEALLNYAEATAELGEAVDYNKSINLLRRRVGMPDFDATIQDPYKERHSDYGYPLSNELFEIRRERRVELGLEGYRTRDYKRWAAHKLFQGKRPLGLILEKSEYPDMSDDQVALTTDGFIDSMKKSIPNGYGFDEKRDYLDCVPTNEITLNSTLTQNPGW